MATIAEVARGRRADLRALLKVSRTLDAEQEKVEREVKRLANRKKSVPEVADADRILGLLDNVATAVSNMAEVMQRIAKTWAIL
jgi:hypothetical protein